VLEWVAGKGRLQLGLGRLAVEMWMWQEVYETGWLAPGFLLQRWLRLRRSAGSVGVGRRSIRVLLRTSLGTVSWKKNY